MRVEENYMYKIIGLFFVGLIWVSISVVGIAEEHKENNPPTVIKKQTLVHPILGAYQGKVFNGDDMDPIITSFYQDDSGKLVGRYAMGEENGLELGELSNIRIEKHDLVLADWRDKYGTGMVRMLFSADYQSFNGFWGEVEAESILPWNGTKE